MESLSGETFLEGVEMIQQQLRIKREDHWSQAVCKLKFVSFKSEFPEVNDSQFCWACEQWIQQHSNQDYVTFPLWRELMTPLYAAENGQANRSWGFKGFASCHCAKRRAESIAAPNCQVHCWCC